MNSFQNIIFQPNIQNSLILNNYLIQNFIVTTKKLEQNKKQSFKLKNFYPNQNKMVFKTPKNKTTKRLNFQNNNNINKIISSVASRKLIDDKNFNYNNLRTFNNAKESQNKIIFPKPINITTINSKEKRPQDSVKKCKKNKNK